MKQAKRRMDEPADKKYLIIVNDAPYGSERPYNALRLALALTKRSARVRMFLMADAVYCAIDGQKPPTGYYSIERMLRSVARRGEVATCGTCQEARGIEAERFVDGVRVGSMDLLGEWTLEADQVINF